MKRLLKSLLHIVSVAIFLTLQNVVAQPVNGYIKWSKYVGGNGDDRSVALLSDGTYLYNVLNTTSTNLPVVGGLPNQPVGATGWNVYVVKYRQDGTIVWSRYLGGSADEYAGSFAKDGGLALFNGDLYLVGMTTSSNFPVVGNASTLAGGSGSDYFVTRLDASGNIVMSRYLGGAGNELSRNSLVATYVPSSFNAPMVNVDNGNVYVMGHTESNSYPVTVSGVGSTRPSISSTYPNTDAAVITKLNPATGAITYSKYFGGSRAATTTSMDVEDGNIYLASSLVGANGENLIGATDGSTMKQGGDWGFQKINASNVVEYSKYIGSTTATSPSGQTAEGINRSNVMAYNGNMYFAAGQDMPGFPVTDGSNPQNASGNNSIALKLNPSGTMEWANWISATTGFNAPYAQLQNGKLVITGGMDGSSNKITDGSTNAGDDDAVMIKLNLDGSLAYGSQVGGDLVDGNNFPPTVVDGYQYGNAYAASSNFPVTNTVPYSGGTFDRVFYVLDANNKVLFRTFLGGSFNESTSSYNSPIVIGKDVYVHTHTTSNDFPVTEGVYGGSTADGTITKYSLCPTNYRTDNDKLLPLTQTVCQNGLANTLIGQRVIIPSDSLPKLYRGGTLEDQFEIDDLRYQWQVSNSLTGPFVDIPGATLKDYLPSVGGADQYYRRIANVINLSNYTGL